MGLLGVELLLAASLLAVGALCLRHARRRQVPASWSCPELPFELSCPDLPIESSPTETETETAATAESDDESWDPRPIPVLAGVGERARGAPPTAVASWLTRAGPPDDS
jgi:hypothetical protein